MKDQVHDRRNPRKAVDYLELMHPDRSTTILGNTKYEKLYRHQAIYQTHQVFVFQQLFNLT